MAKRFFWFALVLFLVTQGLQLWSSPDPSIVDLELAFTEARAEKTLEAWGEAGKSEARLNLWLDFLFIAGYVALMLASLRWAMKPSGTWLYRHGAKLQRATIAAGLLDVLENFLLLGYLAEGIGLSGLLLALAGCAASLKFLLLLAVVIVFFVWLWKNKPVKEWLIDLQSVLRLCRANVIVLLVGWAFLLLVPQGRDVVHTLGEPPLAEKWLPILWFFIAVTFWAWNIWYWARVMLRFDWPDQPSSGQGRSGLADDLRKHVPRILGVLSALAVAAGFASAAGVSTDERTQAGHWRLFAISCALALLFYLFAFLRTRRSAGKSLYAASLQSLQDLGKPTRLALGVSLVVTIALFVAFSINPGLATLFQSAAVLLLAGSAWVPFGALLVYVAQRYEVPVLTLILVGLVVFSFWNDNHAVRELCTRPDRPPDLGVESHFSRWLDERPEVAAASAEEPYPVMIVASEGGGIRAAYWTATVLGRLQDKYEEEKPGRSDSFADHVYAISGVSGGSLGAAVFAALVREQLDKPTLTCGESEDVTTETGKLLHSRGAIETCAHLMLKEDFLSPTVAALLYPDLVQRFLPFPIRHFDRGRALEVSWEKAWDGLGIHPGRFGGAGSGAFNDLWQGGTDDGKWHLYRVPLLFLNTTHVESGGRVLISPLAVDPARFLDVVDLYDKIDKEIRLSTAAHASARFTFVSPAGTVRNSSDGTWGHVVDGGYFENSGATAALEILQAMKAGTSERRWSRLRPIVLMITNDPALGPEEATEEERPRRFLKEALSPFVALLQTRGARGRYSKKALESTVEEICALTCVPKAEADASPQQDDANRLCEECGHCEPHASCNGRFQLVDLWGVDGVPLGWALSAKARASMDREIEAKAADVTKLLF